MSAPTKSRIPLGLNQQKNKLWVGRVELTPDPATGKRRQREVSSMVYETALGKFNKLKRALEDHADLPTGTETVKVWLAYWMDNIDHSRPSTRAGYRSSIKYIEASIGRLRISQLTAADIRKIEHFIVKTKGLSPTTARQAYQVISMALGAAEREDRVFRNVAKLVDSPRKAVPRLGVLTADEGIEVIRGVVDQRLGSRIAAALLTGARQGELLGLEIDRVDFGTEAENFEDAYIDLGWQLQRINWLHGCDGKCGRIRGTDCQHRMIDAPADWEHRPIVGAYYWSRPKSKAGIRVIPLVEPLRSILLRRVEAAASEPNPYGLVWTADPKKSKGGKHTDRRELPLDGMPIDPSRDNKAWHEVLANTLILQPDGTYAPVTDVRLHDARHTAVTILYDLGVPETTIQDIVGQSTISVTRGYRSKSRKLPAAALQLLGAALTEKLGVAVASGAPSLEQAAIIEHIEELSATPAA